jgi:hypothetical protein
MRFFNYALLLLFLTGCTSLTRNQSAFHVSRTEARGIGQRIFMNECAGKEESLIAWNEGEEFPSLGIGHFIWYPKGCKATFKESFPSMMAYMSDNGARPPSWVRKAQYAPWKNREDFEKQRNSWRTRQLRAYLAKTKDLQTQFMVKRFFDDMPKMIKSAPPRNRDRIQRNLYAVASSPYGMYPLIDYVNFKGAGIKPEECYNRQGWGLRQVLEEMEPAPPGKRALNNFAAAADKVLTRRVYNSPAERGEKRWLPGWRNRINTYCP